MSLRPPLRHLIFPGITALAVAAADARGNAVFAQGKLDARYAVTVAGLPVGQGAWVIDIGDDRFVWRWADSKGSTPSSFYLRS